MTKKSEVAAAEPPADHIEAETQALDRLVAIAEEAEFDGVELVGDIRDTFLDIVKNRPKPWSQMSQIEQRDLVKAAQTMARTFVRKVVLVVAQEDKITVDGTLKGYTGKGGLFTLKIEARGDQETALELFKMDGHSVVITSADAAPFNGQKSDVETDPDQPEIPFSDPSAEEVDLEEAAEEPSEEAEEEPVE